MLGSTPIRLMTDCFRVVSSPKAPLFQIPPQKGFATMQAASDLVPLRMDDGSQLATLYPRYNKRVDAHVFSPAGDDTPVCVVSAAHSPNAAVPEISKRSFDGPRTTAFLCDVSYGVQIGDTRIEATVSGSRMVEVGKPFVGDDERSTVELEIVEMYLAGYDQSGAMITVRGGSNLNLPRIPGRVTAVEKGCDFPAELYFDLTLEIAYWGEFGKAA